MKIFISYAREQQTIAERCATRLRAEYHKVFFDKDNLASGERYDTPIRQQIAGCDLFIFLISPQSVESGSYALAEMGIARGKWERADGHILPVQVVNTVDDEIPEYLKSVTILRPNGELTAEVLTAVDRIQQSHRIKRSYLLKRVLWTSGIAALVGVSGYCAIPVPTNCRLNVTIHAPELNTETHPRVLVRSGGMTNTFLISSQGNSPVEMTLKAREPWTLKVVDDEKELLQPVDILGCPTSPIERSFNGNMQLSVEPR